ncbi:MAG: acylphosphatase [Desulfobacterales bacterium]|nr:acylphosphatase [Desulfobacterales bacterium]
MMDNIRVRLVIEGRVQGVWFRESTRKKASSLGLSGWVRNRPDRTVEALAEGARDQVEKLISWCHKGPPVARVDKVHENREEWNGEFKSFDVVFF